ncbi:MAG TPA: hypothetical protein VGN63_23745 [Flavisolibacter sp.]|jgi:hypothetical protein|nr:hypothetical protein [Flavisolibacter sp.]
MQVCIFALNLKSRPNPNEQMPSKRLRYLILFLLPFILFVCGSKSVVNSQKDLQYIQAFTKLWQLRPDVATVHNSFEDEIQLIHALQDSVVLGFRSEEIAHKYFGDISYYYTNRKGLCYDRAVLMEKILRYYGFSFRHAYVYFGEKGKMPSTTSLLRKGLSSHALFEVKTSKGWMAIGTNSNWLGLSSNNEILTIKDLREKIRKGTLRFKLGEPAIQPFWTDYGANFKVVYGLYSRHGDFFTNQNSTATSLFSNLILLPDYNYRMLLYNFFD